MEFEEMQIIWNEQNNEKLYAINEAGLHKYVQRKSASLNKWLGLVDWIMMIVNIGVGLFLWFEMTRDNEPRLALVLPGMYIAYGVGAAVLRRVRKQKQIRFETTILGEIDKALWQVNYLMEQGHWVNRLYLFPLALVGALYMWWENEPLWALFMLIVLPLVGYVGVRWENRKWHGRKKRELEELRTKLLAADETI